MDEKLQQELLMILRELRTGTPEAFQMLLEQRVTYCWVSFWTHLVVSVLAAMAGVIVGLVARRLSRGVEDWTDTNPLIGISLMVVFIASLVAALVNISHAVEYLTEAMAPLGRVLEMLR